jgi:hypothetical protein
VNRDTFEPVNLDFVVTGKEVLIYNALSLSENTGYKLTIVGKDLLQPVGYVKSVDGEELLTTQSILFTTSVRTESEIINQTTNADTTESQYILSNENKPILVQTLKLEVVSTVPELGETMISPAYLAENGIRITFNRPIDLESARKYVKLSHWPLAGIRAMAYGKDEIVESYEEGSEENYCLTNRNEKLNPPINMYVQGSDLLLTYPDTVADIAAMAWIDPTISSSSSSLAPFISTSTSSSAPVDYDYLVVGELSEETHAFNFGSHTKLYLSHESYAIKDRIIVFQGEKNNPIYDSGCIATNGNPLFIEVNILPNVPFYVTVLGGCDSNQIEQSTAWNFRVSSFDHSISSSISTGISSSSSSGLLLSSSSSSSSSLLMSSSSPFLSSSSAFMSSSSSISSSSYAPVWAGPVLNAEVRVDIDHRLSSDFDHNALKTTLAADYQLYFSMGLFPIYADLDMIRIGLDELNRKYDDQDILRIILKNSLAAWKMSCESFDLCAPTEAALFYAENKTILDIFDTTFVTNLRDRGTSKSLGDFSYRLAARESNNRRNVKESDVADDVRSAARELKSGCGTNDGILWAIKGYTNLSTKPNFRTRTYRYLANEQAWMAPGLKGYSRYIELPKFGEAYS